MEPKRIPNTDKRIAMLEYNADTAIIAKKAKLMMIIIDALKALWSDPFNL